MDQLMAKHKVHPDFLQILLSFAAEAHAAEGASSNFSIRPGKAADTTGNSRPLTSRPSTHFVRFDVPDPLQRSKLGWQLEAAADWRVSSLLVFYQ